MAVDSLPAGASLYDNLALWKLKTDNHELLCDLDGGLLTDLLHWLEAREAKRQRR